MLVRGEAMLRKAAFLAGLFLLCACVLILQIVETRILSVISFYHLAFFAISMAMFGITAGALIVYFNQDFFAPERLLAHLSWIAAAFALTAVLSTVVLISTVLINWPVRLVLSAMLWLKLIAGLLPPYVFAGMGISLALTRSPWPIGQVYGTDLAGASLGCLGALVLMSTVDGVSAMLMVAALGASAALAFAVGCTATEMTRTFASFAAGFSFVSILTTVFQLFGFGYSFGGTPHFAGQRFAGRLAADPKGSLTLGETVLVEGEGAQANTLRWEDYTQTAVDPSDDCTIWYVGDYFKKDAVNYSTRIGAFRMPGCS